MAGVKYFVSRNLITKEVERYTINWYNYTVTGNFGNSKLQDVKLNHNLQGILDDGNTIALSSSLKCKETMTLHKSNNFFRTLKSQD